jgi:hypothetical protein
MKFGVGDWKAIFESNCLPGKTNAQMNLQLQRLLGQQSTSGKLVDLPFCVADLHMVTNF